MLVAAALNLSRPAIYQGGGWQLWRTSHVCFLLYLCLDKAMNLCTFIGLCPLLKRSSHVGFHAMSCPQKFQTQHRHRHVDLLSAYRMLPWSIIHTENTSMRCRALRFDGTSKVGLWTCIWLHLGSCSDLLAVLLLLSVAISRGIQS